MTKKILIVGATGKIGSAVCEKLKSYYEIIEAKRGDNLADFEADLLIDFGSAESSVALAEVASRKNIPLIIGSTGQSNKQLLKIDELCKNIPYMVCANFSIGMVVFKSMIEQILKIHVDDISIFEKHHKNKKDSPSGTAISIKNFIEKMTNNKVQMLSQRGGEEIGTHTVDFYFGGELIEIQHKAFSRNVFADGVKFAVAYLLENLDVKKVEFDEIVKKNFNIDV